MREAAVEEVALALVEKMVEAAGLSAGEVVK